MYIPRQKQQKTKLSELIEYQKVYLLQYGHFMNYVKRFIYYLHSTHESSHSYCFQAFNCHFSVVVIKTCPHVFSRFYWGNNFDKTFDIQLLYSFRVWMAWSKHAGMSARVKKSARKVRAFLNSSNIPKCLDQAIQTRKP